MNLDDLRRTLTSDIGEALEGRSRIAFVNYPDISNVGDAALWLGSFSVLADLGGDISWIGTAKDLDVEGIARSGAEAIAINGGGNFGDLWPGQQQAREALLEAKPDVRVVQLPQSVHFSDPRNEARNVALWSEIPEAVLMWRDEASMAWGLANLPNARHLLSHDTAFGLRGFVPTNAPEVDELWLIRQDRESRGEPIPTGRLGARMVDWADPDRNDPTVVALRERAGDARRKDDLPGLVEAYRQLADVRVARGIRTLSAGSVVVTDRLHGHVLATLIGRPNVVLDNTYGKVHGVVARSTGSLVAVHPAASVRRAVEILDTGAGRDAGPSGMAPQRAARENRP